MHDSDNAINRIKSRSVFDWSAGCWIFSGPLTKDGYPRQVEAFGRHIQAHRALYRLVRGDIADGLQLDHLCRNRACINPDHLEPVTPKENIRRGRRANSEKAYCKNGHSLDGAWVRSKGGRMCKRCGQERQRRLCESGYYTNAAKEARRAARA